MNIVPRDTVFSTGGSTLSDSEDELVLKGTFEKTEDTSALVSVGQIGRSHAAMIGSSRVRVIRALHAARDRVDDLDGACVLVAW